MNTFGYVGGNPVIRIDPKGLFEGLGNIGSFPDFNFFENVLADDIRRIEAAASAANDCLICTASCVAEFAFGTGVPPGEVHTFAFKRALEERAKDAANKLAKAGKAFGKRAFPLLTAVGIYKGLECTAECLPAK